MSPADVRRVGSHGLRLHEEVCSRLKNVIRQRGPRLPYIPERLAVVAVRRHRERADRRRN
jgi:hypothetical protein